MLSVTRTKGVSVLHVVRVCVCVCASVLAYVSALFWHALVSAMNAARHKATHAQSPGQTHASVCGMFF
jgi:hypothetical protein